jgi:hypothetical protein
MPDFREQVSGSPYAGPIKEDIEALRLLADFAPTQDIAIGFRTLAAEASADRRCARQAHNALRAVWLRFAQTLNPNAKVPF